MVREGRAERRSDRALRELAASQHGVLSLEQLERAGLSARAVRHRAVAGRLSRVHAGIYAVGPLSVEGRWAAALLATGPRAVLSHRSAAALWGIASEGGRVEVANPTRGGRSRPGLIVHRAGGLAEQERAVHRRLPCTTVARTLLDVAATLDRRSLERAVDRAEQARRFDLAEIHATLQRSPRHPGARALGALLVGYADPTVTRSDAEELVLALIDRAGLPRPRVNAYVALPAGSGREVDLLWPDRRLAVEIDSRTFHETRAGFASDRQRDRQLTAIGLSVVRFTATEIAARSERVAAELRSLLGLDGP